MNGNGAWDGPVTDSLVTAFGLPGWSPVIGNWNGDGKGTKIGIYKDGVRYQDYNGNGMGDTGIDKMYSFGAPK
jgi:hypothetical protein